MFAWRDEAEALWSDQAEGWATSAKIRGQPPLSCMRDLSKNGEVTWNSCRPWTWQSPKIATCLLDLNGEC
jgi:hypothetical protein